MRAIILGLAIAMSSAFAGTVTIVVNGTNDYHGSETSAIEVSLSGVDLSQAITFSTTSSCGFNYGGGCGPTSPADNSADGEGGYAGDSAGGGTNGIASAIAPYNSLIGVFLTAADPSSTAKPAQLDFTTGSGTGFTTLSPGLKQAFFIGDGLTGRGSGSSQTFFAPSGTTRLWLGSQDGSGWFNNGGSQSVTITYADLANGNVPEPSSILLMLGAAGVFAVRRKLA